jgi:hypothetical protein
MKLQLAILTACVILCSAGTAAQTGSSGMAFLKLGVGGRSLGMGEASVTSDDPSAAFYNPAAPGFSSSSGIMLMHKAWFQDVKTEYLMAHTSLGSLHIGVSVNNTSVGDIQVREIPGPADGTFDTRNAAIGLTAAYRVDTNLAIGATGKFLFEKFLVDEASGLGVDLGAIYTTPWQVRIGASVTNLGSMNALRDEATLLPTTYRFGASYALDLPTLSGSAIVAGEIVNFSRDGVSHFHAGAEYLYNEFLALRAGYQSGYEARSATAGLGIRYGTLHLDYAFMPSQYDLGSSHTVSLSLQIP